jgi:serine protease
MMLSVRLHVFKRPFWGITNPGRLVLAMALLIMILAMTACNSGGGGGSPELPDNDDSNDQETYSLSGMVKAAENTAVDSDVNDVNAFFISNDNAQTAQTIFAPVSLGGYVNKPETGPAGRSYQQGDENDIFLVNLLAGDAIILSIGEPYNPFTSGPDLDLGLYDAASIELLDQSVSLSSRTETLLAPADGTYLIQVYAASGASNYTLTIGQQSTAGQNPKGLRLSGSFVPNQAVVTHKSSMDSDVKNNSDPQLSASEKAISKSHGREQLIELGQVTDDLGSLKTNHFDSYESIDFPMLINGSYIDPQKRIKLATLLAIKKLEARQDIKIAEPNYLRVANLIPDDPYYELQWHYPLIHLPEAWQITQGSADVFVGVIDSGILHEHPDLSTRVSNDGYDFVSDPTRAMDGDGIDPDPEDPGDGTQGGSLFHGTHVTGTIAAATGNGKGIAGVAGHTSILALRALGRESSGTSYDILQAVRYAAGLENDSGKIPQQPADIINLSFGGQSFSRTEQDIYSRV